MKTNEISNIFLSDNTDLKQKESLLDERLAASYMNGGTSPYMDALFSGGVVNLVTNYDMIKQIAEYDNNLINEVKATKTSLEEEKQQSEDAKEEKEKKSEELKSLKSQKQTKVNSLTAEQKEIQAKIDEYDAETKKMQAAESKARAQEKAAEEAAKKAAYAKSSSSSSSNSSSSSSSRSSSTVSKGSGQFMWPVPSSSYVSSPYGYRIHPIYGTKKLHAGMDIAASSGSTIVAADSGTVILASYGYNGGYGNYVIISHGNGYTTRYAHCSSLSVSVGQQVSKGQKIASVGSTGASTGPHCHFEIRINGSTVNPADYV